MALASCSVKLISRGQGRSAVAAAAYRSGQAIRSEYDGRFHDYTRKRGIVYTAILAPEDAPQWVYGRPQLWKGAELSEIRGNSRLVREVMIALPQELSREQNIEVARAYAQTFVRHGMIADVSVHDTGDGNPHAHIMLTTRLLDGDKFGKKCRDWDSRDMLIAWREQYAELTNQYLERYGPDERIDVRSYVDQGINQIPTIHLGHSAHRMEQKGIPTERGDINRQICEDNQKIHELNEQIAALKELAEKELAEQERQRAALFEQQAQKRKEHRLVRSPERQSRKYQNAYKKADERQGKLNQIEQTTDHSRPESPKPERPTDYQEKYKIAERRHHVRERQHHELERRYDRSRDEPEREK